MSSSVTFNSNCIEFSMIGLWIDAKIVTLKKFT